jgi:hypothetical protein
VPEDVEGRTEHEAGHVHRSNITESLDRKDFIGVYPCNEMPTLIDRSGNILRTTHATPTIPTMSGLNCSSIAIVGFLWMVPHTRYDWSSPLSRDFRSINIPRPKESLEKEGSNHHEEYEYPDQNKKTSDDRPKYLYSA